MCRRTIEECLVNQPTDWQDLIERHLHGELDDTEKEQLAAWLDSDTSARRQFVEQVE